MISELHASELIEIVILGTDVLDNHSKIPGRRPKETEYWYVVLQWSPVFHKLKIFVELVEVHLFILRRNSLTKAYERPLPGRAKRENVFYVEKFIKSVRIQWLIRIAPAIFQSIMDQWTWMHSRLLGWYPRFWSVWGGTPKPYRKIAQTNKEIGPSSTSSSGATSNFWREPEGSQEDFKWTRTQSPASQGLSDYYENCWIFVCISPSSAICIWQGRGGNFGSGFSLFFSKLSNVKETLVELGGISEQLLHWRDIASVTSLHDLTVRWFGSQSAVWLSWTHSHVLLYLSQVHNFD